jgi:hypothetical protein
MPAFTALFLGFFAAAWFGWAQADSDLGIWLTIGSILSLAAAVAGAVVGFRSPGDDSAMRSREANRRYGIIVGIEFATAFVGAAVLGATGAAAYIPVWICAVVDIHFFPLAPVLRDRVCTRSAWRCAWSRPSVWSPGGAGLPRLGYAVLGLSRAAQRAPVRGA